MKVLHVLYSGLGGHGNVFFSIVQADKEKEFVHEALFNGVEEVREEYKERCAIGNINWAFVKKKPGLDIGFYKKLIGAIKRSKPDVLFLHGSTQVFWARLAVLFGKNKCRIVVRETQANHLKTKQDWLWLSVAMLAANNIVFLTEAYKEEIKKKLALLYRQRKIGVIPNGINLNQFNKGAAQNNGSIYIGMQSRIVPIKDHATLIKSFSLLVQDPAFVSYKIILQIAGDGESRKDMEALAQQLSVSQLVQFTGMIPESALVDFLQGLHIYVHASFGETMSTAIMQAMACAKPIIASDVPGISNMIINGETGILVPVENIDALKTQLKLLLLNKELAEKLAFNAQQFAKDNFSNEIMFKRYKAIFKQ